MLLDCFVDAGHEPRCLGENGADPLAVDDIVVLKGAEYARGSTGYSSGVPIPLMTAAR